MSDSESEYEEVEELVFADFTGNIDEDLLKDPNNAIKIINLTGDEVIAEINGIVFKGTYDYAVGTRVFLEKEERPVTPPDPLVCDVKEHCKDNYRYICKTTKELNFKRILIEKKKSQDEESDVTEAEEQADTEDEDSYLNVSNYSYEELLASLEPMQLK